MWRQRGSEHTFVSVGTSDKTVVYTYGRYGELGKDKSSARGTTPIGEGVLIRLSGNEAKTFIQDQIRALTSGSELIRDLNQKGEGAKIVTISQHDSDQYGSQKSM